MSKSPAYATQQQQFPQNGKILAPLFSFFKENSPTKNGFII